MKVQQFPLLVWTITRAEWLSWALTKTQTGPDRTGLNFIFLILVMFTSLATWSDTLMMISLWNGFSTADYGIGTETHPTRCRRSEISIQNSVSHYIYSTFNAHPVRLKCRQTNLSLLCLISWLCLVISSLLCWHFIFAGCAYCAYVLTL